MAHRRHRADAIALLEVLAGLLPELRGQLDVEGPGLGVHLEREAGVAQHLEHAVVGGMYPRGQRGDPGRLGELCEVRQQQRRDPAPLPGIRDGEGELGAIAGLRHEARVRDDLVVGPGDREEAGAVADELRGGALDVEAGAQEAEPACALREPAQERGDPLDVSGADGAQVNGGAVAQDDVARGIGGRLHGVAKHRCRA
jgi:hypothetical protein